MKQMQERSTVVFFRDPGRRIHTWGRARYFDANQTLQLSASDVVLAVFAGENILQSRVSATWNTWIQSALAIGMHVVVFSQRSHSSPFPVVGVGGGRGNDHRGRVSGAVQQMWSGYGVLLREYPHARFYVKVDDDSFVHARHLPRVAAERIRSRPPCHALLAGFRGAPARRWHLRVL